MPYPSADPGGAIITLVVLFLLVYFVDRDERKNKKGK
jgi:hypothetical protein